MVEGRNLLNRDNLEAARAGGGVMPDVAGLEARAAQETAGATPIPRESPGYVPGFDGNHDGVFDAAEQTAEAGQHAAAFDGRALRGAAGGVGILHALLQLFEGGFGIDGRVVFALERALGDDGGAFRLGDGAEPRGRRVSVGGFPRLLKPRPGIPDARLRATDDPPGVLWPLGQSPWLEAWVRSGQVAPPQPVTVFYRRGGPGRPPGKPAPPPSPAAPAPARSTPRGKGRCAHRSPRPPCG